MEEHFLTRRGFISLTLWSWLVASIACRRTPEGKLIAEATPIREPTSTPTPEPTATATHTATPKPSATSPSALAVVGVVRKDEVTNMVRRAIELAGGLSLSKNDVVLIKPNVNSGDPFPGTTNPAVVEAVVEVVKEHHPRRIIVADHSNPGTGLTLSNMEKLGIAQAARRAGAEVIGLEDEEWQVVKPTAASHWAEGFSVPKILLKVDYLITLPVIKTHSIATYTMALKNTVGLIHPQSRRILHAAASRKQDFGAMLAEINLARPADFVVMDGTRAFVSGGPARGELREPSLVVATHDLVAADVTGLAVLKNLGTISEIQDKRGWEQPQVARAVELGLGVSSPRQISLRSEGVPEIESIREFIN